MRTISVFGLLLSSVTAASAQSLAYTVSSGGFGGVTYGGRTYSNNYISGGGFHLINQYYEDAVQYFWPACTVSSDNSTYVQCIYRNGSTDSVTVRYDYAVQGTNTLQATVTITNNSAVHTLSQIDPYPFGEMTVGSDTITTYTPQNVNLNYDPAYFVQFTSGSLALWTDFSSAGLGIVGADWLTGARLIGVGTYYTIGPTDYPGTQTVFSATVPPLGSLTFKVWLRFGNTSDSVAALAPEAGALYSAAQPTLMTYADRRRIGTVFLAELRNRNANNPRGYLNDTINALNPTAFAAGLATEASTVCTTATQTMIPAAQGVLIWDLEGTEFNQAFTYVGAPNRLADIAPEMDVAADAFIASIKACGLKVGFTLRPQHFLSGTSLPGTCNFFATITHYGAEYDDVFINTSAYTYPSSARWAACQTAPNTWTYDGNDGGGFQTDLQSISAIESELLTKAQYAISRWGASYFYVDSAVYSGGGPLNADVFRYLQTQLPGIIIFPEEETTATFSATAPYANPTEGIYQTSSDTRQQVPGAFRFIAPITSMAGHESEVRSGIQSGDIYSSLSWFNDPDIQSLNTQYAVAAVANTSLVMVDSSTGRNHSFSGKPDSYTYPLFLRVYFGTSASNVTTSTTWCQKQATVTCYVNGVLQAGSSIDLSTFTWSGMAYVDFTGTLRSRWSVARF